MQKSKAIEQLTLGQVQSFAMSLCPYCGMKNRHHWPSDCVELLRDRIGVLELELEAARQKLDRNSDWEPVRHRTVASLQA